MIAGSSLLGKIDFSLHRRLLQRLSPDGLEMAVCSREGELVWPQPGAVSDSLTAVLQDVPAAVNRDHDFPGQNPAADCGCLTVPSLTDLHFCPLRLHDGSLLGWLAVRVDEGIPAAAREHFEGLLAEVAAGITRDCRYEYDLDNMVDEVARRYEELNLMYGMRDLIKKYHYSQDIFEPLITIFHDALDAALSVIIFPEKDLHLHRLNPTVPMPNLDLLLTRMGSEIYRFIASSKEPLIINREDDSRKSYLWTGVSWKIMAIPIMVERKMTAALMMLRADDQPDFSNSDRNVSEAVAEQVGIIILNQVIYGQLETFSEEMAATMIEAIDAKDPYTRGHSDRVNRYSMAIGEALGLSEADLKNLYWASLLHDLGKIGVPDRVLGKVGKLDEDEYVMIKAHSQRSHDILAHVKRLAPSLPAILHHHERCDGKGYPDELSGVSIPLHARIIAVADTFDAITSSRSYRPSRSVEEAMAELQRVKGTQLDGELVDLWLRVYPEKFAPEPVAEKVEKADD